MLKHQLGLGVSVALLLSLFASASIAQQTSTTPAAQPASQCGGQYECVENRPMTPAEAQASRSPPQNSEPQDPKQIATAQPTVANQSADEGRHGTSAP
jgi:hypothetical protein